MDSKERLIQIKEGSGMNWKEFSAYFQIPYRTVQDCVSQWRYAFNRNSSNHSGSSFFDEIKRITASLIPRSMMSVCTSVLTVSYTHLDVYKRQVINIVFFSLSYLQFYILDVNRPKKVAAIP